MTPRSLVAELKRRNVYKVAVAKSFGQEIAVASALERSMLQRIAIV